MAGIHSGRSDSALSSPLHAKTVPAFVKMQLSPVDKQQLRDSIGRNAKLRCCIHATEGASRGSRLSFEYLNKGAANVVFKIRPFSPSSTFPSFQFVDVENDGDNVTPLPYQDFSNKVLRVSRGRPKHLSGEAILSGFKNAIFPLFVPGHFTTLKLVHDAKQRYPPVPTQLPVDLYIPNLTKHLMEHQGVLLMASAMNDLLARTEKDTFHVDDNQKDNLSARLGILLPNMSPVPGESITLEIKPKWLSQSPNAPQGAIRCRTCALQIAIPKNKKTFICPLRLLYGTPNHLYSWAHNIVTQALLHTSHTKPLLSDQSQLTSTLVNAFLTSFTSGAAKTLLRHLEFLQSELDRGGVLRRSSMAPHQALFDYNLRLAMTLRDCSLFIKIPYHYVDTTGPHGGGAGAGVEMGRARRGSNSGSENVFMADQEQISVKLGDLDFKSAEKIGDWEGKERILLDQGLYTRRGENGLRCWLEDGI